jgi:hypothetical protein
MKMTIPKITAPMIATGTVGKPKEDAVSAVAGVSDIED